MSAGPLSNCKSYLNHIALPNCVEYFIYLKSRREGALNGDSIKELRLFLNVIESLNNALEYAYFDRPRANTVREFKDSIFKDEPNLKILSDIANTYKHCIRKQPSQIKEAKSLVLKEIHFTAGMQVERPLREFQLGFPGIDNQTVTEKSYKFWFRYLNEEFEL